MQNNQMVTEEFIKELIDTGQLLATPFTLPQYTKKCLTKERLVDLVYLDENELISLHNSQLVRFDKVKSSFTTSLSSGTFAYTSTTRTEQIVSQYGYTVTKVGSWITLSSMTGGSGVRTYTVSLSQNPNSSQRTGSITFKENTTGKQIVVSITQQGAPAPTYTSVRLMYDKSSTGVCTTIAEKVFYIASGETFQTATALYTDTNLSQYPPAAYYKEVFGGWRRWTGTAFTTSGNCL